MAERERLESEGKEYHRTVKQEWSIVTVQSILDNDFYVGTFRQEKYTRKKINGGDIRTGAEEHLVFENHHQPIVDSKLFSDVRSMRQQRSISHYRGVKKNNNVYSGFLECGDCGSPMFAMSRADLPDAYRCGSYHRRGAKACSSHHIRVDKLDDLLKEYVRLVKMNSADMLDQLHKDLEKETTDTAEAERSLERLSLTLAEMQEELIAAKRQRIRDIMRHPEREEILETAYDEIESELLKRIDGLNHQIAMAENRRNMIIRIHQTAKTVMEIFDDILSKPKLEKRDVQLIIEKIWVYENRIEVKLKSDIDMLLISGCWKDYEDISFHLVQKSKNRPEKSFEAVLQHCVHDVNEGDSAYDAAAFRLNDAYKYTNYCVDLMALENMSIEESWWDSNSVKNLSIAGTLKMIAGDIFYKHYNGVYMLLFNKNMYSDLGLADPYEMVKNGEWTLDTWGELCAAATQDLNGDGTMDRYDRYGFASQAAGFAMSLINGAGMTLLAKDDKDIPYSTVDVEKLDSLFQKYDPTYINHTFDATRDANNANESAFWVFPEGRSLFFFALPNYITWKLRDVDFDYGILPIPKYDEAQKDYYSTVASWHSYVYMLPKSAASAEDSAYIMDVLAFWGEDMIKPAYYDITLQRKLSKDSESADMLDIIFNNMVYDLGYYAKFGGFYTTFTNAASKGEDMSFASMYASCKTKIDQEIAEYVQSVSE